VSQRQASVKRCTTESALAASSERRAEVYSLRRVRSKRVTEERDVSQFAGCDTDPHELLIAQSTVAAGETAESSDASFFKQGNIICHKCARSPRCRIGAGLHVRCSPVTHRRSQDGSGRRRDPKVDSSRPETLPSPLPVGPISTFSPHST